MLIYDYNEIWKHLEGWSRSRSLMASHVFDFAMRGPLQMYHIYDIEDWKAWVAYRVKLTLRSIIGVGKAHTITSDDAVRGGMPTLGAGRRG